jgi:hypothetical protein
MEIELWRCEPKVMCSALACTAKAVTRVRYLDEQGRFIRRVELCDEHLAKALAAGGAKVHDRRDLVPPTATKER